jgi:hypothetical protein
MTRWLGIALCCLFSAGASAEALTRIPTAGLLQDVDLLQRTYESLHPGLNRYNTPDEMRGHFDTLRRDLAGDPTLARAFVAFSQFAAKVRCGHTYPNFYNQSGDIVRALFQSHTRVPFEFRWLDRRMIVTRNLSNDATLIPGTEVLTLEGIPVRRILDRLMTIARADGSNDAKRMSYLEVRGRDEYEAFDIFLPLFFAEVDAAHTLTVRAPHRRRVRAVTVPALTHAERLAAIPKPAKQGEDVALWDLAFTSDGIAVLTMPNWVVYNTKWDWRKWLDATFDEIARRDSRALVIDIRANEGGSAVGDEIIAHLIDKPLPLASYERRVRYRAISADLRPYLSTWDPAFQDWGDAAQPIDARFFRLTRSGETEGRAVIEPRARRFAGRVFVLTSSVNSSAAFEFAMQLQHARLGTLVGEVTGGNQRGINGGAFFFLKLPNSGIELDVPLIGQFPRDERPDAGVTPDVLVSPSIADVAAGRDAELATVRRLLR